LAEEAAWTTGCSRTAALVVGRSSDPRTWSSTRRSITADASTTWRRPASRSTPPCTRTRRPRRALLRTERPADDETGRHLRELPRDRRAAGGPAAAVGGPGRPTRAR